MANIKKSHELNFKVEFLSCNLCNLSPRQIIHLSDNTNICLSMSRKDRSKGIGFHTDIGLQDISNLGQMPSHKEAMKYTEPFITEYPAMVYSVLCMSLAFERLGSVEQWPCYSLRRSRRLTILLSRPPTLQYHISWYHIPLENSVNRPVLRSFVSRSLTQCTV